MRPLRFGIIACSSVARRRFLPALAGVGPDIARLQRVGSRDLDKAAHYAREFACPLHGDYESVLQDPDVDIVYISTPPLLHEEWVLKAAKAGKHVWCEKPAFSDLSSAKRALCACEAAGVRLVEGYVFACHPQHTKFASLVSEARIGHPRLFSAEFTYPRPPKGDIRLKPEMAGGVLHDSAGYLAAAALLQMPGEPTAVFCTTHIEETTGVDDSVCLWISFDKGGMASMHAGFDLHYRSRYSILGTQGRIELTRAFAVPTDRPTEVLLEDQSGEQKIAIGPADQFGLMIKEVARTIQSPDGGTPFEKRLLRQHIVMDAAVRSVREGRVVQIKDLVI
jgi:NDP-hexose-3-ketoreductase